MTRLNQDYWSKRYQMGTTNWDLGGPSRPIKEFTKSLRHKDAEILIPGAGNAYDAEFLWHEDFKNIFILDLVKAPLKQFKKRIPCIDNSRLIHSNYFAHTGQYDLIIEQTFFCALAPNLRRNYVDHTHQLLKPYGLVAGVLFDFELSDKGPPYGGDFTTYYNLFKSKFHIRKMEPCYNSEPSRIGKELFFIFEKK